MTVSSRIGEDELRDDRLREMLVDIDSVIGAQALSGGEAYDIYPTEFRSIVTELLELRRSAGLGTVSVKPLEWKESSEGYAKGQWFAETIFGEYCTYMHPPSGRAWLQGPSLGEFYDTIQEAKAAAQSDFETRVKSCLTSIGVEAGK